MNYTVVWIPSAEQDLAALWIAAANRPAVTQAANQIDQQLRRDPANQGESRDDGMRVLLIAPLGVRFEVLPDDRPVRILHVWSY